MANSYVYQTNKQLRTIDEIYMGREMKDDHLFDIMPIGRADTDLVEWEQKDFAFGYMRPRGLNGKPTRVAKMGSKKYAMQPGVYGQFQEIDEVEITRRRQWGTVNGPPIDVRDLVDEASQHLLELQMNTCRIIGWSLLISGFFSMQNEFGAILHTDSYTQRTYTSSVAWSTPATATPLADFRAVTLLGRGYSVDFGSGATAYMNRTTFNRMISNTNAADLGGKRTTGQSTLTGLRDANTLLSLDGSPNIVILEDGYYSDASTFTLFVPDGKVLVVGRRRNGQKLCEWIWTRNANTPGFRPGAYLQVVDRTEPPKTLAVHRGFNGGAVIYYPSAFILMSV